MKVYVASSWRNPHQPGVVYELRKLGYEVYDFCNPKSSFHWSQIDPNWEQWTSEQYREALDHPLAVRGFQSDFAALQWADVCVLVLPSGRSSHLEAGIAVGAGKPLAILSTQYIVPELMYRVVEHTDGALCTSFGELEQWLKALQGKAAASA